MPCALGLAVALLLQLGPSLRAYGPAVFGNSLFFSLVCYLWIVSGASEPFDSYRQDLLHGLLLTVAFDTVGLVLGAARSERRPKLVPLLVLFFLGWLISYFSSGKGGADPMIEWFMRTFGYSHINAEHVVVAVRKIIHVSFYAAVATVGARTMLANGANRRTALKAGAQFALSFASFDELRQSTMPNRQGSFWDVLLDMAGAVLALVVFAKLDRIKRS